MKKILNIFTVCLLALLSCTSCDNESPNYEGKKEGEGTLSLKNLTASVVNAEVVMETRGRATTELSDYVVTVTSSSTSAVAATWKYGEMPEVVALPVGDYVVTVASTATEADTAWDTPYYKGSQNFSIKKGEVTEVGQVTCTLKNLKVGVFYSDELAAEIGAGDDVHVVISLNETKTMDFAYGETRAGFFKCDGDQQTLMATFSGTIDGCYISDYKILTDVAPGQYRKITFSLKDVPDLPEKTGQIGTTGLSLVATVTTVDLAVNVPGGEEIIEPDDFMNLSVQELDYSAAGGNKDLVVSASSSWMAQSSESWCTLSAVSGSNGASTVQVTAAENTETEARTAEITFVSGKIVKKVTVKQAAAGTHSAPIITSSSIDLNGDNIVVDGMTVDVDIVADAGIKNLMVKIVSEQLTDELLKSVGLTSEFDLCNPGQYEEGLNGLGLPTGDAVFGKTSLKFDISGFMQFLKIYKGTHKFELTVIDAEGENTKATITLTVK